MIINIYQQLFWYGLMMLGGIGLFGIGLFVGLEYRKIKKVEREIER